MNRRLPNTKNGFLGHGAIVAEPIISSPPAITATRISTGEQVAVSEPVAYAALFHSFRAVGDVAQSEALAAVLETGGRLANKDFWFEKAKCV